jgi:hypothetical protein
VELVIPVSVLVELGGVFQGFDREGPKLKEPFLVLGKTPEAGETMSVQDFPFECYNASVKATASPLWCLPPEEVVDDRQMITTVHDHQVRCSGALSVMTEHGFVGFPRRSRSQAA